MHPQLDPLQTRLASVLMGELLRPAELGAADVDDTFVDLVLLDPDEEDYVSFEVAYAPPSDFTPTVKFARVPDTQDLITTLEFPRYSAPYERIDIDESPAPIAIVALGSAPIVVDSPAPTVAPPAATIVAREPAPIAIVALGSAPIVVDSPAPTVAPPAATIVAREPAPIAIVALGSAPIELAALEPGRGHDRRTAAVITPPPAVPVSSLVFPLYSVPYERVDLVEHDASPSIDWFTESDSIIVDLDDPIVPVARSRWLMVAVVFAAAVVLGLVVALLVI